MPTHPRKRPNVTVLGEVAAAIAALSSRYVRTIARQITHVAKAVYETYCRFEDGLVAAATDLSLFVWSLRNFVLIVGAQIALVMASFRWPLLWLPTLIVALLLITAAVEVARRPSSADDDADRANDWFRNTLYFTYAWLLRISLFFGGLSISIFYVVQNYETSRLRPPTEVGVVNPATVLKRGLPTKINLRNKCKAKTLWVAVNGRDRRGRWMTHGWYRVKPGAVVNDVVTVYSPIAYLYAFSEKSQWKALDSEPGRSVRIKYEKLAVVEDQLKGEDVHQVRFFAIELSRTGEHTHAFACDR